MKRVTIILIIFAVLALAVTALVGCGTTSADSADKLSRDEYAQVEVGMSAADVTALLGEPSRKEEKSMSGGHSMGGGVSGQAMEMEDWYYQGDSGWVRLELADGKVTGKEGY
ncbi:MAG: hypothetical protein ACYC5A_08680 [Thermoleophilia bacterium]